MIAIISYHREPNYGTQLQAYALAKAIKLLGYNCEYISYYEKPKYRPLIFFAKNFIARFLISLNLYGKDDEFVFFYKRKFRSTLCAFNSFHARYIPCSRCVFSYSNIVNANEKYSLFVVGSDQTWSPYMTKSKYCINFLDFVENDSKKCAYAPSFGRTAIPDDYKMLIKNKLSSFRYLSCRERQNCSLIKKITGRNVEYVLDPTFLLSYIEWEKITNEVKMPPKYVLCYILGEKQCISDYAIRLGLAKNIPVFFILTRPLYLKKANLLKGIGPSEFIFLIKHASYVITDSFHGTILSINFNVNFYGFSKRNDLSSSLSNDNDRIKLILSEFELVNRFKSDSDTMFEDDIDFTKVNKKLESLKESSTEYLMKMVSITDKANE